MSLLIYCFLGFFLSITARADLPKLTPSQLNQLGSIVNSCTYCHRYPVPEYNDMAPRLYGQTSAYLMAQIDNFKQHKRDDKPNADTMWAVADSLDDMYVPYVADVFSKTLVNYPPLHNPNVKLANQGKEIYYNGVPAKNILACFYCHGADAMGNLGFPRLAGQWKDYIIGQFGSWKKGYRSDTQPMPDIAKALNNDEINALAEFLSTLKN